MPDIPNTVCPELVEGLHLVCHPDTPCCAVRLVTVSAARSEWEQLVLHFRIEGDIPSLSVPARVRYASRCDDLWQTTCVEAFAGQLVGAKYAEFNFAPSTAWAAYEFESYRQPSAQPSIDAPPIDVEIDDSALTISVAIDMTPIAILPSGEPWRLGLSAVIEETDGTKSYWALRHPPGKPDFHHPDCFALMLGAPESP